MILLQLTANELTVLNEVLHSDMDLSSYEAPDYSDTELMKYYSDRATLLEKVTEEISTCLNTR